MSTEFSRKSRSLRSDLNNLISSIGNLRTKIINKSLKSGEMFSKLRIIKSKLYMLNRSVLSARNDFRKKIKALKIPSDIVISDVTTANLTRGANGKFDVDVNNYPKISGMDDILNKLKRIQNNKNSANRAVKAANRQEVNLGDIDALLKNVNRIGEAINGSGSRSPNNNVRPRSRSVNNTRNNRSPTIRVSRSA